MAEASGYGVQKGEIWDLYQQLQNGGVTKEDPGTDPQPDGTGFRGEFPAPRDFQKRGQPRKNAVNIPDKGTARRLPAVSALRSAL